MRHSTAPRKSKAANNQKKITDNIKDLKGPSALKGLPSWPRGDPSSSTGMPVSDEILG